MNTQWFPRRCSVEQATHEWQDIQGRGPHGAYLQWREDDHVSLPTVPMKIAEEVIKTVAVVVTTAWACYLAWLVVQIVRSIKA